MLVAVFLTASALMLTLMAPMFAEARRGEFALLEGYAVIGGVEYAMFEPTGGFNVTSANVSSDYDSAESFDFTNASKTIGCRILRDNDMFGIIPRRPMGGPDDSPLNVAVAEYLNGFVLRTDWGWWSYDMAAVSYEQVIEDQLGGQNISATDFFLRDTGYTLIVTTGGNASDHEGLIWANAFNLAIGQSDESWESTGMSTSFWSIIGQMLTAQLPNTQEYVNILITAICWSGIGFMAIMIVSRFIPFVGGG